MPSMWTSRTALFFSALASLLVNVAPRLPPIDVTADTQATRVPSALFPQLPQEEQNQDALDESPDPFFDDVSPRSSASDESIVPPATAPPSRSQWEGVIVDVYENEAWGLGRGWRGPRSGFPRWSYKDGTPALAPGEILPPDDWIWVTEWKIDRSGGRDQGGWEYTNKIGQFDSSKVPRQMKLTHKFRRRRWVRAMRPKRRREEQGANERGLPLESLTGPMDMGAPALHIQVYDEAEEAQLYSSGEVGVDLLPVPENYRPADSSQVSMPRLGLGHALTAVREWWEDEFTFRGFGIGVVKPIFRGVLLRPDIGLGIRLPLTLHFRSWEQRDTLPSVTASFFVFWPPAFQISHALSYPTETLQEWSTAAVRRIVSSSKQSHQQRERKDAMQRLGVSLGMRFSTRYGFQWWLAPYFFLLPGMKVLLQLYMMVLAALASLSQTERQSENPRHSRHLSQEGSLLMAVRYWATVKTSGLGYSLNYSGSRLGAAVMLNFQPFFLPSFRIPHRGLLKRTSNQAAHAIDEPQVATKVDEEIELEPNLSVVNDGVFSDTIEDTLTSPISQGGSDDKYNADKENMVAADAMM
ncbi:unnamed protein product [Choristocarpus tenellus]